MGRNQPPECQPHTSLPFSKASQLLHQAGGGEGLTHRNLLGIGGISKAQNGVVHLAQGGGGQVLPEQKPPEILKLNQSCHFFRNVLRQPACLWSTHLFPGNTGSSITRHGGWGAQLSGLNVCFAGEEVPHSSKGPSQQGWENTTASQSRQHWAGQRNGRTQHQKLKCTDKAQDCRGPQPHIKCPSRISGRRLPVPLHPNKGNRAVVRPRAACFS